MEDVESNEKDDEFSEQDISPAENDTNTSAISDKTSCTTCLKLKLQAVGHTVGVSSTKIFFGGFFWQVFAFAASQETHLYLFALAAGVGDAVGVSLGNLLKIWFESKATRFPLLLILFPPKELPGYRNATGDTFVVGFASFFSGFAWQPLVNWTYSRFPFTIAALFVGSMCGTIFLVGILVANSLLQLKPVVPKKKDFIRDVSLCIAVAGAAAFFVGTDFGFPQNWLRSVVGERDGSDKFLDCLRSGFSTFLGFICFSIAQILLIPNRYLWTAA
jgi:hypothetical protein